MGELACRPPVQRIIQFDRDHRTWSLEFGEHYVWDMSIYKVIGEETLYPLQQKNISIYLNQLVVSFDFVP